MKGVAISTFRRIIIIIIMVIKSIKMRWAGSVARIEIIRHIFQIFVGKSEEAGGCPW
jgi:hypothetical protein